MQDFAKNALAALVLVFLAIILVAPAYAWLSALPASPGTIDYFRLLGLYAFSLVFVSIFLSAFADQLAKLFPRPKTLKAHMALGIFALILAFSHPLALYAILAAGGWLGTLAGIFVFPLAISALGPIQSLGTIALYLIVIAVIAGILRKKMRYTTFLKFHDLSYLAFFFGFFHSILIGTHLRNLTALSFLWFAFLIIVVIGLILKIRGVLSRKRAPVPESVQSAEQAIQNR
ncbi:MAG: ferric reductase-like transmembrane domain-containing protein [archaeon]